MYNINLGATHTTILSTGGVTIPIYLVSNSTDSIKQCVVLFKAVTIPTSDPKSEFLCQSSLHCAEPTDPLNTSYAWDISHALVTTYHPYCHSPSALTEYLKQKLHHQRAKRLGRSLPTQVEQKVPLERNNSQMQALVSAWQLRWACDGRCGSGLPAGNPKGGTSSGPRPSDSNSSQSAFSHYQARATMSSYTETIGESSRGGGKSVAPTGPPTCFPMHPPAFGGLRQNGTYKIHTERKKPSRCPFSRRLPTPFPHAQPSCHPGQGTIPPHRYLTLGS